MSNSTSIINLQLFILLLIFANYAKISAYTTHDRSFDQSNILYNQLLNDDISSSKLYLPTYHQNYIPKISKYDLRRGVIHLIPYKKRTIPLELQKALYAHGIIGR